VSINDVLSKNLSALMAAHQDLDTPARVGTAAGLGASNVGRMRRGEVASQIDSVEKVARAFRLRACDLLDPELAKRLEEGQPLRAGEPRPPTMPEDEWRALSPRTRAFVEDLCSRALSGMLRDDDIVWLHDAMHRTSSSIRNPSPGR